MTYVCGSGIWGMLSARSGASAFFASYWYRPENMSTARRRVGVELNRSGLSDARSDDSSTRNLTVAPDWAGALVGAAAGGDVGGGAAGGVVGFAAAGTVGAAGAAVGATVVGA